MHAKTKMVFLVTLLLVITAFNADDPSGDDTDDSESMDLSDGSNQSAVTEGEANVSSGGPADQSGASYSGESDAASEESDQSTISYIGPAIVSSQESSDQETTTNSGDSDASSEESNQSTITDLGQAIVSSQESDQETGTDSGEPIVSSDESDQNQMVEISAVPGTVEYAEELCYRKRRRPADELAKFPKWVWDKLGGVCNTPFIIHCIDLVGCRAANADVLVYMVDYSEEEDSEDIITLAEAAYDKIGLETADIIRVEIRPGYGT